MRETPDLFLEREELLECDIKTGNIKVDKQIFDDFVPNSYINIQFVEDEDEGVWQFSMVAEDDEGIFMEYLDYIQDDEEEIRKIYAGNANGIFTNDDEVI